MAYLFDDSLNQYLGSSEASVSAMPLTIGCKFRADDASLVGTLIALNGATYSNGANWYRLVLVGSVSPRELRANIGWSNGGSQSQQDAKVTEWDANTWHWAVGTFVSASERTAWLDAAKTTNTGSITTPSAPDRTYIGKYESKTFGDRQEMSGEIAEAFVYDCEWTDELQDMLLAGLSPTRIQPENLINHWRLIEGDARVDHRGTGNDLTAYNSASYSSAHPIILGNAAAAKTEYVVPNLLDDAVAIWCPSRDTENTGTDKAYDFTGNGRTGTLTNMDVGSDWVAGGLDFDGVNDRLTVSDSDDLSFTSGGFAISMWINKTASKNQSLLYKQDEYELYLTAGNTLHLQIMDAASSSTNLDVRATYAGSGLSHVVATWDGVNAAGVKLYVDGVSLSTTDGSSGGWSSVGNKATDVLIGGRTTINFDGVIDDVRIYNRPLSQLEINALSMGPGVGLPVSAVVGGGGGSPFARNFYERFFRAGMSC